MSSRFAVAVLVCLVGGIGCGGAPFPTQVRSPEVDTAFQREAVVDLIEVLARRDAPVARLVAPSPGEDRVAYMVPTPRFQWELAATDGPARRPVRFKYRVIGPGSSPSVAEVLANPELLGAEGPAYSGWTTTSATQVQLPELPWPAEHVFAVIAWDPGAEPPVFSRTTNVLRFITTFPGAERVTP